MLNILILLSLYTSWALPQKINPWPKQPVLSFDNKFNFTYQDANTGSKKTIFPIMLYSFENWDEIKDGSFWKEANQWGVNIIYSWDVNNEDRFLNLANKYNMLALINGKDANSKGSFISLPDEPIGGGTADVPSLKKMRSSSAPKNQITYLNHDVAPYFYRKSKNKKEDPFDSKLNCSWCKQGRGTQLSYTEANQYADILAFDFYPYNNKGIISRDVSGYGSTSVGEFTRLLKDKYPNKPVWPVIQTLWFSPFNEPYEGKIINHQIIRNLTFDAIVNGADGVSFFGHGQTRQYSNKKEYAFLKGRENNIWLSTLQQCFELKELQTNFDQILLEDNLYSYSFRGLGYSYAIKKVNGDNKYYLFVVNHLDQNNNISINSPIIFNINSLKKIGKYSLPPLSNISAAKQLDLLSQFKVKAIRGNYIDLELQPYSVAIFSLS